MMEQQSLLTELEFNPVLAGTGKRFLNYLIDLIMFYVILFLVLSKILSHIIRVTTCIFNLA